MFKKICYFFTLVLFAKAAFASAADDLTSLLGKINTMQSSFIQTVYDNHQKPIQKSYGKMALDRPGKFRWEVTKPVPQLIIASGKKLWIYDPDLEQVTIKNLTIGAGDSPALLLSHNSRALQTDYQVSTFAGTPAHLLWFNLVPKSKDNMFAKVEMGFNAGQIEQMRLQDHLGHVTSIQFKEITTNGALSANTFIFKAPKGTDVIDETRK